MADAGPVERVTTLELFFDLVFVFTVTQLTALLVADLSWTSVWHAAVMLSLIFWMYDGYAWLTNAVPARGGRRQGLLLGGMAGYLVLSLAIPAAFSDTRSGLVFGLALFVVTGVHALLFVRAASEGSAAAMRRLAPVNLLSAALVVVGGALGGTAQAVIWTGVALYEWFPREAGAFEIGPAHFVERHGLLIIVAIGESVVAIGAGARDLQIDVQLVVVAVLALGLNAGLWFAYFGREEEIAAERAMAAASGHDRVRIALHGFGYAHGVMLFAVILTATGIETAIEHPRAELSLAAASALSGGVALFLLGDAWLRETLGLGRTLRRGGAAAALLVAVPVGTGVSAFACLAATTLGLAAALALEPAPPPLPAPAL